MNVIDEMLCTLAVECVLCIISMIYLECALLLQAILFRTKEKSIKRTHAIFDSFQNCMMNYCALHRHFCTIVAEGLVVLVETAPTGKV